MTASNQILGRMKIKRGILQRDSVFSLIFVLGRIHSIKIPHKKNLAFVVGSPNDKTK